MKARNRTNHKHDSALPENAQHQLTRAFLTTGVVLIPHLHHRHHKQRWEKSLFHMNRKQWLDLQSRYLRGE